MRVVAFAPAHFFPVELPPFGEKCIARYFGVDERQMQMNRPQPSDGKRERFLVDPLAAADEDFSGKFFRDREGLAERGCDMNACAREGGLARNDDWPPPAQRRAWPRLEADAAEDDDLSVGFGVEKFGVLGDPPGQPAVTADHAILGAGDDEMEGLGHRQ